MVQVPDLLGYLFDEFVKAHPNAMIDDIHQFVEHSRGLLKKDPPVGIDYSVRGLGVIMTGGKKLTLFLFPQKSEGLQEDNLYEPEIPVTCKNRQQ